MKRRFLMIDGSLFLKRLEWNCDFQVYFVIMEPLHDFLINHETYIYLYFARKAGHSNLNRPKNYCTSTVPIIEGFS